MTSNADSIFNPKCGEHAILACPICAKNGRGCVPVQSHYHRFDSRCLYCLFCGWEGTHETVQSYKFPCVIYRVVEINFSVLENMVKIAFGAEARIASPLTCNPLTHEISGGLYIMPKWGECDVDVEVVLDLLVGKGWLFPAVYKVCIDV